MPTRSTPRSARLAHDRRGAVALYFALATPALAMAVGMGAEVSNWSASKVNLQRVADAAAAAAAVNYQRTYDAHAAATAADNMALINGATGGTPSWDASTQKLTDGQITVQRVNGPRTSTDPAFQVTLRQSVSTSISRIASSLTSVTVPASATSELVVGSGGQPCLLALSSSGTNISLSGGAALNGSNCSVRSNASINMTGNSSITAAAVFVAGTVSGGGTSSVNAPTIVAGASTLSDPYAHYAPVQTALALLSAGSGSAVSVGNGQTQTISAGTYASISVTGSGVLNLNAGRYVINGNISVANSAQLNGTGVTIVTSGTISATSTAHVTLSAAGTSPTNNAVSGVVIAGTTSGATSFGSNTVVTLNGVVYLPNSALSLSAGTSGTPSCLEYIVSSVSVGGTSAMSGNCSSWGAPTFGTTVYSAALVQ